MEKDNKTNNEDLQKDVSQNAPLNNNIGEENKENVILDKSIQNTSSDKNTNSSNIVEFKDNDEKQPVEDNNETLATLKKEINEEEKTPADAVKKTIQTEQENNKPIEKKGESVEKDTIDEKESNSVLLLLNQQLAETKERLDDSEGKTIELQQDKQNLELTIQELRENILKQDNEQTRIIEIRDKVQKERDELKINLARVKNLASVDKHQAKETLNKAKTTAENKRKRLKLISGFLIFLALGLGYFVGDYFNFFGQSTHNNLGNQGSLIIDSLDNKTDTTITSIIAPNPDENNEDKTTVETEQPDDKEQPKPTKPEPKPEIEEPKPDGKVDNRTFVTKMKNGINRKGYYTETVTYKGIEFDIFAADISKLKLRIHWQNSNKSAYTDIKTMKEALEVSGAKKMFFATNGGIYSDQHTPEGLFVYKGKTIKSLNTKDGKGNFYLKPNGVFAIDKNRRAYIVTTDFYKSLSQQKNIEYAVQSGPMLSINGKTHSAFGKTSKNKFIRNGVGIPSGGSKIVVFAITNQPCNFYTFSKLYQEQLGCKNALYLDGAISEMYINDPSSSRKDLGGNFVTIINISAQ